MLYINVKQPKKKLTVTQNEWPWWHWQWLRHFRVLSSLASSINKGGGRPYLLTAASDFKHKSCDMVCTYIRSRHSKKFRVNQLLLSSVLLCSFVLYPLLQVWLFITCLESNFSSLNLGFGLPSTWSALMLREQVVCGLLGLTSTSYLPVHRWLAG